jgi:hypothetical protein
VIRTRGTLILIVFFSLFSAVCLLVPNPMPPGNVLSTIVGIGASDYAQIVSALINGVFYGLILWSVFVLLGKRLGEEK